MDLFQPLSSLVVQLGSRQIQYTFTDVQKKFFQLPAVQALVMFFIFFSSTKKLTYAAGLTIMYYVFVFVLLNEKHPFNILPRYWLKKEGFMHGNHQEKEDADIYDMYLLKLKQLYPSRFRD